MGGRAVCGPADCRRGPGIERLLTTEQTEKVDKVRAKYHDQRAEIFTKMATIRGEMRDLLSQPEPDFAKVGERIDAMSDLRARLARMRLEQHREIRGLLTDEQRAIFDRGFAGADGPDCGMGSGPMGCGMSCAGTGGPGCGMSCAGTGGPGCGMSCAGAVRPGCEMSCAPMGAGAPAGQAVPGCAATCKMMQGAASAGGGCPMAGAMGSGLGVRPQSGEWRRWL